MASAADLVTLNLAKSWLNIQGGSAGSAADAILGPWITAASRMVVNYLDRGSSLGYRVSSRWLDGAGKNFIMLPEYPVLEVTALSVNGTSISQQTSAPFGSGYRLEEWTGEDSQGAQRLFNFSGVFPRSESNVFVTFKAGYALFDEAHTIPTSTADPLPETVTVTTARPLFSALAVEQTDGTPFTYTTGTPVTGEYSIDEDMNLVFALDDADIDILVDYSYTPEDIRQAVLDVVAYWYRNRDRIGITSRGLGGQETTTFSTTALPDFTKLALSPYCRVIPV